MASGAGNNLEVSEVRRARALVPSQSGRAHRLGSLEETLNKSDATSSPAKARSIAHMRVADSSSAPMLYGCSIAVRALTPKQRADPPSGAVKGRLAGTLQEFGATSPAHRVPTSTRDDAWSAPARIGFDTAVPHEPTRGAFSLECNATQPPIIRHVEACSNPSTSRDVSATRSAKSKADVIPTSELRVLRSRTFHFRPRTLLQRDHLAVFISGVYLTSRSISLMKSSALEIVAALPHAGSAPTKVVRSSCATLRSVPERDSKFYHAMSTKSCLETLCTALAGIRPRGYQGCVIARELAKEPEGWNDRLAPVVVEVTAQGARREVSDATIALKRNGVVVLFKPQDRVAAIALFSFTLVLVSELGNQSQSPAQVLW